MRPLQSDLQGSRGSDRKAIAFPSTIRRKIVCVNSLPRVHWYLHLQRVRKRDLSITTTGTILITIMGTTPIATTGNNTSSDSRTSVLGRVLIPDRASARDLEMRAKRIPAVVVRVTRAPAMGKRATGRPATGPRA